MGQRVEYDMRRTVFEPDKRISYEGESTLHDAKVERHITVEARGDRTLVTIDVIVDAKPLEEQYEGKVYATRFLQRESDTAILNLKELFEMSSAIKAAQDHLPSLFQASTARDW
jgi:hypothetical protein